MKTFLRLLIAALFVTAPLASPSRAQPQLLSVIELYRGKPEIKIMSKDQIQPENEN